LPRIDWLVPPSIRHAMPVMSDAASHHPSTLLKLILSRLADDLSPYLAGIFSPPSWLGDLNASPSASQFGGVLVELEQALLTSLSRATSPPTWPCKAAEPLTGLSEVPALSSLPMLARGNGRLVGELYSNSDRSTLTAAAGNDPGPGRTALRWLEGKYMALREVHKKAGEARLAFQQHLDDVSSSSSRHWSVSD